MFDAEHPGAFWQLMPVSRSLAQRGETESGVGVDAPVNRIDDLLPWHVAVKLS
jgi:hypothetical protein